MDQDNEKVEGQLIARAILANADGAWARFDAQYKGVIVSAAEKRSKSLQIRSEFDCDDIVNGFYTNQLLDRPVRMFGPVAEGQRPLTPRILDSLKNYCNSLHRSRKWFDRLSTIQAETIEYKGQSLSGLKLKADEAAADLIKRFSEQLSVIRSTFIMPSKAKVPQREILLLSERLILAENFSMSHCREDASAGYLAKVEETVIAIYPWGSEETSTLIPEVNEPLSAVWELLTPEIWKIPFGVDGNSIAKCLRIERGTWYKWVQRARESVVEHTGVGRAKALFPYWPASIFNLKIPRSHTSREV